MFATAGMHPHEASEFDARAGAEIEELLGNPLVVGVGECGLDFFRMRSPREDQERVLRTHVGLARESGLPLVVHVRDAWPDILRVLDEGSAEQVVLHCFSGDADIARACTDRGWYLSFAGNVTYPKNAHLRDAGEPPRSTGSSSRPTARSSPRSGCAGATTFPRTSSTRSRRSPRRAASLWKTFVSRTAENARSAFPRLR